MKTLRQFFKDLFRRKEKIDYYMYMHESIIKEINNLEKCVICKKPTKYNKDTPINERKCYVETAGQLCEECFKHLNVNLK